MRCCFLTFFDCAAANCHFASSLDVFLFFLRHSCNTLWSTFCNRFLSLSCSSFKSLIKNKAKETESKKSCEISKSGTIFKASLCAVLGSGGHTTEMLELIKHFGDEFNERTYIVADTDTISKDKVSFKPDIVAHPRLTTGNCSRKVQK